MSEQERPLPSARPYVLPYVGLLGLLALTLLAATLDLGVANLIIALLIAAAKAILIVLFFMHLRHTSAIVRLFAGLGFMWLLFLIILTLMDYANRPFM